MATPVTFHLNGDEMAVVVQDHWTLLHLLREELGLTGTKEGCGSGECGACTVIIDGMAVNSCLYPAIEINGKQILTIEGLASADGTLHPIQQSFVNHGGIQCGFCSPGMIMAAKALLDENPHADESAIRHGLAGNLCRCTGYIQIIQAVKAVSADASKPVRIVAWKDESS